MDRLAHSAKQWIRRLLARLDIGIYRLHHAELDATLHNSSTRMDEHYQNNRVYSRQVREERKRFQSAMLSLIRACGVALDGGSVADVGCGTGDLLALLAESCPSVRLHGYETSPGALREAAATCPRAQFSTLDITVETAGPHDVVFCLEVLEHLPDPDTALKNLLAMILPGGSLVLSVPDARFDNFGGHINFWGPVSWRRFLHTHAREYRIREGQLTDEFRLNFAVITRPDSQPDSANPDLPAG